MRARELVREAKHALFYTGPDDDTDDEGGIDARDEDPRCYVCGAPASSTDSGCCGVDGECYECPRW